MLTPQELERLPESVIELFSQAESDIIADMAKRLSKADYASTTTLWEMQKLADMQAEQAYILERLSEATQKSVPELIRLFGQAGQDTLKTDDAVYKAAGFTVDNLAANPKLQQIVWAGLAKTNSLFENLTRTTANTAARQFEAALDRAQLQISSGAFTYQKAISEAIKDLSAKGIAVIQYPSGHTDYLDVAVRRATLTGVNQTAAQLQMARAEQFGCDLVETTAHAGARPEHQIWQGKVFSRSGNSKKYPNFVEVTGYGTGAGLCGWNCRHSFYPFFEGISESAYPRKELATLNNASVIYKGKKLSLYDATQAQRAIERNIRKYKREFIGLDSAQLDTNEAAYKLKKWRDIQNHFVEETGLRADTFRSAVTGFGRSQASKATWAARKVDSMKRILSAIDGVFTSDGICVKITTHLATRSIGRVITVDAVLDAIKYPLNISEVIYDDLGRPSKKYIGTQATVSVNPANGNISSVWKTGRRILRKLGYNL